MIIGFLLCISSPKLKQEPENKAKTYCEINSNLNQSKRLKEELELLGVSVDIQKNDSFLASVNSRGNIEGIRLLKQRVMPSCIPEMAGAGLNRTSRIMIIIRMIENLLRKSYHLIRIYAILPFLIHML